MISYFRWRLWQFPSRQYGAERTDLPRNPVPETHILVLPLFRQLYCYDASYRLRFIQWCRSNLRNRNDKKNKLEILWNVKHTTQDGRIIQNVLSWILSLHRSEIGGAILTTLYCTVRLVSLYILICSSFCCDFQILHLCIKYYYLNPVFSSLFSFR